MRTCPTLCAITKVTDLNGSPCCADWLRAGSSVHVPEKSGRDCALSTGRNSIAANAAAGVRFIDSSPDWSRRVVRLHAVDRNNAVVWLAQQGVERFPNGSDSDQLALARQLAAIDRVDVRFGHDAALESH